MRYILIFILSLFISRTNAINKWYFAQSGNDGTGTGAIGAPWKSVDKFNSVFASFVSGDSVLFNRGDTFFITTNPMTLNKSGTLGNNIHIGAYGTGMSPVITSLISFTWTQYTGGGNANYYRTNESGLGSIADFGLRIFTKNDHPLQMGRWPAPTEQWHGYDSILTPITRSPSTSSFKLKQDAGFPSYVIGAQLFWRATRFWTEHAKATAFSSNIISWTSLYASSFDGSGNLVGDDSVERSTQYWGFGIENDSAALRYQDAWWFSAANDYIKMFSVGNPGSGYAGASLNNLFLSNSFSNWDVNNIEFNGCNQDGVVLSSSNHIDFKNCSIRNAGRNDILLSSDHCTFDQDTVIDACNDGFKFYSGARFITITNCLIRDIGQLVGQGDGARDENGKLNHAGVGVYNAVDDNDSNEVVLYNWIINCGYACAHYKRQNNINISSNYMDSAANIEDDGGVLYTVVNDPPGNYHGRITNHNLIFHGIGNPYGRPPIADPNAGVKGIYHDNSSCDNRADSNVIAYAEDGYFANHGDQRDTLENNIFFANTSSAWHLNTNSKDKTRGIVLKNNFSYSYIPAGYVANVYNTGGDNTSSMGIIDNNIYTRPLSGSNPKAFHSQGNTFAPTNNDTTLARWKVELPYDGSSSLLSYSYASTITQDTSVNFVYNKQRIPQTFILSNKYTDYKGVAFNTGSIVLQPFSADILFYTGELPGSTGPWSLNTNAIGIGTVGVTGSSPYNNGSVVTITATPGTNQIFSTWSGSISGSTNPFSLTMDANKSVTATFISNGVLGPWNLNININGTSGSGTVIITPNQTVFNDGDQVTLNSNAAPGFEFVGWSGDIEGTQDPFTITMTSDKNITANFVSSDFIHGTGIKLDSIRFKTIGP